MPIESIVIELLEKAFPGSSIKLQTKASDVEGWDSLRHIDVMISIERKFNISFTTKDLLSPKNVGELIALIESLMERG